MSSRIISVCLLLSFQFLAIHCISAQSFKGKWQGSSEGKVSMMTFDKKGYITFIINGETIGGKKFTTEGYDMTMRYEYNDKVEPHTLDFIITMADDGIEILNMLGIFKFENRKTLIVNMDFEGKARPEFFNPEDKNQIVLTKMK